MIDFNKPETIGTIVGTAIAVIAAALAVIGHANKSSNGKTKKKTDSDEINRVGTVIDIAADLRDEIARLEKALEESKRECARRIDEIVIKYDRQLSEMAERNAELKRRLDKYEGSVL